MSLPAAEIKLLLYLGEIGLIGLELNSEENNFSFICCAKQRPSSIRSGVEFSFNDYNLRSFCKHPRSMQYSRILFCCFKGSRAFLSSLFFSACIFSFVPGGAKII